MSLNTPVRDQATQASIWLLAQVNGQGKVFEFAPGNDRCVVIGSACGADVPLEGLAPVALYLQRDGTGIRLIPAYAETGCRVNAQPVRGPCVLQYQALLELSGYQIALYISEVSPNFAGHVPAAPQSGTTVHTSAPGGQTSCEPRAHASVAGGDVGFNAAASHTHPRTFVLGSCHSLNSAAPVAPRKVTPGDAATAARPNSIQPTPILALGSDPGCRPRPLGTQALSPSELAAIRAMAPARQPFPPQRLEQPAPGCPVPFDQTRHSASSMPVAKVLEYPAENADLPKVIPFEPMRVAASQVQGASSLGHAGSHSTVVDVKAVSPLALAAHLRAGALGAHANASNHPSDGQRSSGHVAHAPRPMDMQRVDAFAAHTSKPPASGSSQLGGLARRQSVALIGAVIVGSLILVALIVGTARLLQPAPPARVARNAATAPTDKLTAAAAVSASGAVPPNPVPAPPTTGAFPVLAAPAAVSVGPKASVAASASDQHASANGKAASAAKLPTAAASAEDLTLPNAAGHLFASRLPEAEQAYRELAANNPDEPIFLTVVRLLGKRNSPECRSPTNHALKSCPTVKP